MRTPRFSINFCWLAAALILAAAVVPAVAGPFPLPRTPDLPPAADKAVSESGFDYFIAAGSGTSAYQIFSDVGGYFDTDTRFWAEVSFNRYNWILDGQSFFVGSTGNWVYEWDGAAWHYYYLTDLQENYSYSAGVQGVDRDDVWFLSNANGNTTLSHFDGSQNDGNYLPVAASYNGVALTELWGLTGSDLYLAGNGGAIAHFDGTAISLLTAGDGNTIRGLWGTGHANVYAVGDAGALWHFNGAGWTDMANTAVNFTDVWGTGPDDVFVCGGGGTILHFDGSAWSQMTTPGTANLRQIYGSSPQDVYAVGNAGAVYHYDGTAWTNAGVEPLLGYDLIGIWGGLRQAGDQNWASGFGDPAEDGQGANEIVLGLQPYNGGLAASGNFNRIGAAEAAGVAWWGGDGWSALQASTGFDDYVYDLEVYDGQLIASGGFDVVDGDTIRGVAAWDGAAWNRLGAGLPAAPNHDAWDVTVWNDQLVVVGDTLWTAAWDGADWTRLAGFSGELRCVTTYGGALVAAGALSQPGQYVLTSSGGDWLPLPGQFNGEIYSLYEYQGLLLVGGLFTAVGEVPVSNFAAWNGTSWSAFGGGADGYVLEIAEYDGELFAGGWFTTVGGVAANGAALLSGEQWRPLGSGLWAGMNSGYVWKATTFAGRLFVGGFFNAAGNHPATFIGSWGTDNLTLPAPVSGPAAVGADYSLRMNITGDPGPYPVVLHYRTLDDQAWQAAQMTRSQDKDGIFETIVPPNVFQDIGFQYYVSSGGGGDIVFFPEEGESEPAFTPVTVTNAALAVATANQYIMMGVPFEPGGSMSSILTGALGAYDKAKWRFGRWDPVGGSYDEYPNVASFAPGRGYWLIQRDPQAIPASGVTTSTVGGVTITLEPGWNMIAAPYNFPVLWGQVTLGNNVQNRLVARSGGGYADVTLLNPWQGYWVRNTGLTASWLTIPAVPAAPAPVKSAAPAMNEPVGQWEIVLDAESGDRFDRRNVAAVATAASDGLDALDLFEAPALPGDVSLFFEQEGTTGLEALSRDVRTPVERGQSWDLVLRADPNRTVSLTIDGVAGVPAIHQVQLLTAQGAIDLRTTTAVSLNVGAGGELRLRLAVGDADFVDESEQTLPRPFALGRNYPNPFNPMTAISFSLPHASRVRLEIYDLRGHLVRRLVDDRFEPGTHQADWDGRDDGGRSLPAAVYFSRLRAEDFVQTRKMTLVR